MAVGVIMPALEMAQDTGTLVRWLKKEGEQVTKGEGLLQVETDKAVVEIEAAGNGILTGIAAAEGDVVPVGRTIAWIVRPGESPPPASAAPSDKVRISPKARRLALEHGVDASRIHGTGPAGEILAEDVLAAAQAPVSVPAVATGSPAVEVEAVSTIGRRMAERTARSWTTTPHFYVARDADAGPLNAARERLGPEVERSHGVKLTHTDLLVAAAAHALRRHPRVNASWTDAGIALHREVNVALAAAVDDAVVTVVIRDADTRRIGDIAVLRRDLVARARSGQLHPADVAGATFTVSNLGMFQVDAFTAIVVPPQAAILSVGAIVDRVVPVDGQLRIRPMLTLTLGCDHRVLDGVGAARFLRDLVEATAAPEPWLHV